MNRLAVFILSAALLLGTAYAAGPSASPQMLKNTPPSIVGLHPMGSIRDFDRLGVRDNDDRILTPLSKGGMVVPGTVVGMSDNMIRVNLGDLGIRVFRLPVSPGLQKPGRQQFMLGQTIQLHLYPPGGPGPVSESGRLVFGDPNPPSLR